MLHSDLRYCLPPVLQGWSDLALLHLTGWLGSSLFVRGPGDLGRMGGLLWVRHDCMPPAVLSPHLPPTSLQSQGHDVAQPEPLSAHHPGNHAKPMQPNSPSSPHREQLDTRVLHHSQPELRSVGTPKPTLLNLLILAP